MNETSKEEEWAYIFGMKQVPVAGDVIIPTITNGALCGSDNQIAVFTSS